MTRNEMLNQFLILGAALLKESPNGDEHFEMQQSFIKDEVLLNPAFGTPIDNLYKNNIIFNGEQGPIPTIKGWKSIQPRIQTKVVKQMQPKPVEKMTDKELLDNFVDTSITICDRMPRSKSLQKQSIVSYDALFDAVTCVASTLNNNVFVEEVAVEA